MGRILCKEEEVLRCQEKIQLKATKKSCDRCCHIDVAKSDAEQSKLGSCFIKSSYAV